MSPLELEILIHYYAHACDYRDGDFTAPAVRSALDRFRLQDELITVADGSDKYRTYKLTDRGNFFVEHLCSLPLPVPVWKMPND